VLWSSQLVSTVGTRVTSIAFPLLVLAMTHSPAKAGVVGFASRCCSSAARSSNPAPGSPPGAPPRR
jgi:hypothetical protein